MKQLWYLLFASSFLFVACKKSDQPAPAPTPTATKLDLLRDSVYLYSKEVYLWNDLIPAYDAFKPRNYNGSTEIESAQKVMDGIRALQPLDKWSFVTTVEESSGLQTGDDKDLGFFIKAATAGTNTYWYVSYVYAQSNAGQQGVQRGWYINKINGTTIRYDQPSVDILNNVFFGSPSSASFEFVKGDGSTTTLQLTKTSYTANSVLHRSVIDAGGKKVGYLVFNQFFGQPSRNELAQAFTYFQSQGINDLVVDLRNNRGGSTETQDTLANLIAPNAANGQVMYRYIFNNTLQSNQHQLLRKKYGWGNMFTAAANTEVFIKAGTLNLPRVFFIVSGNSASASELLINNLKPYMDVKLIGSTTYGKPVGYFPITIYNYDIYPISFKTVNSAGTDNYYNGFTPDKVASDGVNTNWGDINEPSLAAALRYISTGSFGRFSAVEEERIKSMSQTEPLNKALSEHKFSGMFVERK